MESRLKIQSERIAVSGLLLAGLWLCAGQAQGQSSAAGVCPAGRIVNVNVVTEPVFSNGASGLEGTFYDVGNGLHVETRHGLVRRELLLKPGDCFDPLRLSESERLLRSMRFIKTAKVEAIPRGDGNYDVQVVTRDDWTLRIEPEVALGRGVEVTGIRLAERSLLGTGRSIDLQMLSRPGPERWALFYTNPQWMKTRWDLDLSGGRTEPGHFGGAALRYPFVGLVGRRSAFVGGGYRESWFRFITGDAEDRNDVVLPSIQRTAQFGGAWRKAADGISPRAPRLGTFGATISYESLGYGAVFFQDSTTADRIGVSEEEADSIAQAELSPRNTLRLNAIVGVLALEFVQREGLTSVNAIEDVALGASADLTLGVAAPVLGTDDRHLLVGLEGYAGAQLARRLLMVVRGSFEARRDYEAGKWRDVFGAIDVETFWSSTARNTLELRGRLSAGWQATVPFQLTLGGLNGLRGYSGHRWPGGRRAVVTLEDRTHLLSVGQLLDFGTTFFVDAGEMWVNDAPFGTNSGLRASFGAGLRFAIPTGSRTTYELVVMGPLDSTLSSDGLIITFRRRRFRRIETRIPDFELERSRDVGLRTAVRNLQ
ncbi:MAG: BamA/TamA family outer membrane protein [Longimicrobiales bacterium]